VVPKRSFDETVNAVANQRSAQSEGAGGVATVELVMNDNLMDFIEAKLIQRQNLNISLQGA
jgi:hypothetical protein